MRNTLCIDESFTETSVSGVGRHLGINIHWSVHWRSDGAFVEEINGKELNFLWGCDGRPDSSCWEVDTSGVSRSLEFDDHEAVLISTWVRTGAWLRPHLTARLELELELEEAALTSTAMQAEEQVAIRSGLDGPVFLSDLAPVNSVGIRMKLKGGRLVNKLRVCTHSWVVQSLQQPLCGDVETWHLGTWRPWTADMRVFYPSELIHQAVAGARHVYKVQACNTSPQLPDSAYQLPFVPLLPNDTQYDSRASSAVPVWRSTSGHLLVRPQIDGRDSGGYMILDTGASGFVITHAAAVKLGLGSFGELYAAGISGKVQTQFVRARAWSLGPICIQQPVMMTMALDGLVRGGPMDGDVIGIIGYDLFRRAVVQLPQMCDAGVTHPVPGTVLPPLPLQATALEEGLTLRTAASAEGAAEPLHGGVSADAACGSQLPNQASSSTRPPLERAGAGQRQAEGLGSEQASRPHLSTTQSTTQGPTSRTGASIDGVADSLLAAGAHPSPDEACSSSGAPPPRSSRSATPEAKDAPGSGADSGSGGSRGSSRGRSTSNSSRQSHTAKVKRRTSGSASPGPGLSRIGCPQYTMYLYDPRQFSGAPAQGWQWHTFSMISNLPHLEVTFMSGSGARTSALFMLDTGACGSDMMLHARAIEELQMGDLGRTTTQYVRGVGGSTNTRVDMVDLPWIEVAGVRCLKVRCLYAKGIPGLDISIYSAGILGGDLLARFEVVLDYARKRLGIRRQEEAS